MCAACYPLEVKSVRLWSTTLIVIVGTIVPPSGTILAAADWWRLGLRVRVLIPVAALAARMAISAADLPVPPGVIFGAAVAGLNLAAILLGTVGLPQRVKAHRAAGGASASRIVAVGLAVIPFFCAVGLYQFFSNPGKG